MKHCGTQILETERLLLRPFAVKDAPAMFRNWASDPEVTKYLTWPTHESAEGTRALLEKWEKAGGEETCYRWAIVLKAEGDEPIGSVAVVERNEDVGSMQIGYCAGRKWWHRGIMSEALKAVMDYLFEHTGVNRIECRHDPRNPRSGMVMQKCGMKYEGTLRSSDRNNQGICDACWYAVLRNERQ